MRSGDPTGETGIEIGESLGIDIGMLTSLSNAHPHKLR